MKYCLVLLLLLQFVACDPVDARLKITNVGSNRIYYMLSPYEKLITNYEMIVREQGVTPKYQNCVDILDGGMSVDELLMGSRNAWEQYLNKAENGTLKVYTFDIDTLKKYNWKDIAENNRYLSRKTFTIKDLKERNWEVEIQ